jgi:hypothetical protein
MILHVYATKVVPKSAHPSIVVLADVNECSSTTACGQNTICTNTNGSYACACKAGYTLLEGKDAKTDGCTGVTPFMIQFA